LRFRNDLLTFSAEKVRISVAHHRRASQRDSPSNPFLMFLLRDRNRPWRFLVRQMKTGEPAFANGWPFRPNFAGLAVVGSIQWRGTMSRKTLFAVTLVGVVSFHAERGLAQDA
jgi:hypothetical protein